MITSVSNRLAAFRDQLFKLGNREPLSKLSLTLIFLLDLFVLTVLFQGLADHTRQLTSPEEYAPYTCREVYINNGWNESNRLDRLQPLVLSGYENISYRHEGALERADTTLMHPSCRDLYREIKAIAAEPALRQLFVERKQLEKRRSDLNRNMGKAREAYDTSLLETIADKRGDDEQLAAIASSSKTQSSELDVVTARLSALERQLNGHPLVAALWQSITAEPQRRTTLVAEYKRYQFWYALKKLLWQMLFILPIFFLFYLWSSHSVRRGHTIQTLIASHLLVVSFIPLLFKLIELALDLIPRHFLKNLFRLLESLHLIALWHYLVIFASVGAALLLIYLIQKKLFSQQRTYQRRLMKGECHACGLRQPAGADYCPFCGEAQFKPCPACQEATPISGEFCTRCGARQ